MCYKQNEDKHVEKTKCIFFLSSYQRSDSSLARFAQIARRLSAVNMLGLDVVELALHVIEKKMEIREKKWKT